ncbi:MAG: hypothetical protein IJ545_05185 [Alphaproteobacteria bacterium]|nr:hypothetical protein [Alphaproteobacteria bacterium]
MAKISVNLNEKFIDRMDWAQKEFFLQALVKMASIDGHFDECEKMFILDMADEMQVAPSVAQQIVENPTEDAFIFEKASSLNNRVVALELIKEMCLLAHSDDDLSDKETIFIGKLGLAMGVELEKIEQISNWVIDYLIWYGQGKIIFERV